MAKYFYFLPFFIIYEARAWYDFKLFWDSVPLFYQSVPLLKEILKKGKDRNELFRCLKYGVLVSRGRLELPTSGLWGILNLPLKSPKLRHFKWFLFHTYIKLFHFCPPVTDMAHHLRKRNGIYYYRAVLTPSIRKFFNEKREICFSTSTNLLEKAKKRLRF